MKKESTLPDNEEIEFPAGVIVQCPPEFPAINFILAAERLPILTVIQDFENLKSENIIIPVYWFADRVLLQPQQAQKAPIAHQH